MTPEVQHIMLERLRLAFRVDTSPADAKPCRRPLPASSRWPKR